MVEAYSQAGRMHNPNVTQWESLAESVDILNVSGNRQVDWLAGWFKLRQDAF
jgi:hypothetical protein